MELWLKTDELFFYCIRSSKRTALKNFYCRWLQLTDYMKQEGGFSHKLMNSISCIRPLKWTPLKNTQQLKKPLPLASGKR